MHGAHHQEQNPKKAVLLKTVNQPANRTATQRLNLKGQESKVNGKDEDIAKRLQESETVKSASCKEHALQDVIAKKFAFKKS